MVRARGDYMAALRLEATFDRVRRNHAKTKGLPNMDAPDMLTALIAIILAWFISELLDL